MKCTNCGAEIGSNPTCGYCGTAVQQQPSAPEQGVPVPPPYPAQQPYSGQPNAPQVQNTAPQQPYGAPQQIPQPPYPPYGVPQQPYAAPAPVMVDPSMQKSKLAAGLLGIFLGYLGVHNFYLGYTGKAVAQLLITLLTCFIGSTVTSIWGLIEGIMILSGSIKVDGKNIPLKD